MAITPDITPAFSAELDALTTSSPAHPDSWNPTHQRLLNNDAFLKLAADALGGELADARAGQPDLAARLREIDAMQTVALVEHLKTTELQQGEFMLANRGVVSGCAASKSTNATRNLNYTGGVCFAKGRKFAVSETLNASSVPSNPSANPVTVWAYLFQDGAGSWRPAVTPVGEKVPAGAVTIYQLTIPAGNTDATDPGLASVTLTDVRRVESQFPSLLDAPATQAVLINPVANANYHLSFDIVAAAGAPCEPRAVVATSRATNGFTAQLHSAADSVQVRWKLTRLEAPV